MLINMMTNMMINIMINMMINMMINKMINMMIALFTMFVSMMMINYRGTSTEPEGGILSRRDCLKESSLQPVVDPWKFDPGYYHLM